MHVNTNLGFLLCSNFLFVEMGKGLGEERIEGSEGGLVGDNNICGGDEWW